jgi:hypothetical protein
MPTFTRVLIILCVWAAAILAWQSYGDTARRILAGLRGTWMVDTTDHADCVSRFRSRVVQCNIH